MVSGLVCLELIKVVQSLENGKKRKNNDEGGISPTINRFRNSFVNLALPLVSFAEPVEAEVFPLSPSQRHVTFTLWNIINAPSDARHLTVVGLIEFLSDAYNVNVESVSCGDALLYADFLPDCERRAELTIYDLLEENSFSGEGAGEEDDRAVPVSKTPYGEGCEFVDLQISCSTEEGEEARLPPIRVSITKAKVSGKVTHRRRRVRSFLASVKQKAKAYISSNMLS